MANLIFDHLGRPPQAVVRGQLVVEQRAETLAQDEFAVGSMVFYRVHLDRGMHVAHAMEDESEDLAEIASVILDAATGYFTDDVSAALDYDGSALLVMDRVTLDEAWRGFGLGAVLAIGAVHRLMPACCAIVCSPGIADISEHLLRERTGWDRVTRKIARGREFIGFRHHLDHVFLFSPTSLVLEEQRDVLRGTAAGLAASWKAADRLASERAQ
ncbi:hypothetical protein [Streptomyces sp. NPDC088755]|uniref:hypothetical protein n=1 Tax=Streptomyces sp. NPDC088755 TaxID=3365888 RepID=UPI003818756F